MFYASTSITPDGSLAFTLTVVIAGLSIVLGTLALLILVFSLFGKLTSRAEMKSKKADEKPDIPKPPVIKTPFELPPPPPIIESGTSPEIVAVITAAVAAYEGGDARITSIKRKSGAGQSVNMWAQAALFDNTKPF